jgi:hypothetical protein
MDTESGCRKNMHEVAGQLANPTIFLVQTDQAIKA